MVLLYAAILHLIVNVLIISPALWLSGRGLVGKEKAKFTDAIWIVVLGTVAGMIVGFFLTGYVAAIIELIVWLALVKHFFDCGWLMALAISIIAVIIFIVITVILGLLGFALIHFVVPSFPTI